MEWLANLILFPFRVASTTKSVSEVLIDDVQYNTCTMIQVEEEATHVLVIHLPSSVSLILGYDLKYTHHNTNCMHQMDDQLNV